MAQHCCIGCWTSKVARMLNLSRYKFQCCKLQQYRQYAAQSRSKFFCLQQLFLTCNTELCCVESWARGGYTSSHAFQLAMQSSCVTSWEKMLPVFGRNPSISNASTMLNRSPMCRSYRWFPLYVHRPILLQKEPSIYTFTHLTWGT